MYLMNGARIAISAQAVGIAEAAYREADSYSRQRVQFKKAIRDFSAVYEMLTDMKVNIEAGRSLLYETSRIVDIKEGLEDKIDDHPESAGDLKGEFKRYSRYASLFTPIVKGYICEMANKVCYDAIQIHAGVGFTCEFNVERHYRDVRITNIYEGTTQLQVVAAIGGVIGGVVFERLGEYERNNDFEPVSDLFAIIREFRTQLESAVSHVKDKGDSNYQEFHAKRLVDMATDTILSYLLCIDAIKSERKKKVAQLFISKAKHRVESDLDYVLSNDDCYIELHKDIIDCEEIV
jgi:hypothetical protein